MINHIIFLPFPINNDLNGEAGVVAQTNIIYLYVPEICVMTFRLPINNDLNGEAGVLGQSNNVIYFYVTGICVIYRRVEIYNK